MIQCVTGPALILSLQEYHYLFSCLFLHVSLRLSLHVFALTSLCHHKTPSSDLSGCEPWAARDRRSWRIGNMIHSWVLETWQPSGFSAQSFQKLLSEEFFFFLKNVTKHTEVQSRETHTDTTEYNHNAVFKMSRLRGCKVGRRWAVGNLFRYIGRGKKRCNEIRIERQLKWVP